MGSLLAFVASLMALPAMACSPVPDSRSYVVRLAAEKLAFVGTVTAVSGRKVTFEVAHTLSGSPEARRTIEAAEPSTCAIAFEVGQRWIYAGNFTTNPSVLLKRGASGPLGDGGRLVRSRDERMGMPEAWQSCKVTNECVAVQTGCGETAANAVNAGRAQKKAIAVFGDHRAMACASTSGVLRLGAMCVASRCGSWSVDLNVMP